ncbi:hypothetical protein GCM10020254_86700 [Streptomyces goshikiensis]
MRTGSKTLSMRGAEGQLGSLVRGGGGPGAVGAVRGRGDLVARAQRDLRLAHRGRRASGRPIGFPTFRKFACGGWDERALVIGSVSLGVFLVRERSGMSVRT